MILGLDGVDPDVVDLLLSEGKLPNFARLRQGGAYGRLLSEKPLLSPVIWTTIATGRRPSAHGIGHFVAVDPQSGEQLPVTSDMRRVEALWTIASSEGLEVAVVGWWATWPAETVRGALVSDHTAYHFLFEDGLEGRRDRDVTHPRELLDRLAPHLVTPAELDAAELAPYADIEEGELDGPLAFDDELSHLRWALAAARSYRNAGLELWRRDDPHLGMVYIEGVDSASHLFGHLFRASGLAGELARQQERFGHTVEAMYGLADSIVGDFLDALDDRSTLVVLSDHGFELGVLHDDPSKTRDLRRVSERFHEEEGILYLYGRGVRAGARLDRPTLVDVTPTVLALLGLPAARDMPGRILAEALRPEPPDRRIATYESRAGTDRTRERNAETDAAVMERLRSLGYLSSDDDAGAPRSNGKERRSPQGERNLAAIRFRDGDYEEAARLYRRLVAEDPTDASLRTSLAGVLGAQERYAEAVSELRRALELEPVSPEAHHNLAVLAERRGSTAEAVEHYRWAVRYAPDYEPARQALARLTGSPEARRPASEAEARAWQLCAEASEGARHGDYTAALDALDRAEELAPESVLVHQYRSNVAYLMGDRELAVRALERALELEPQNALFRRNLEQLRAEGPEP
jgi:tetratricopeptide (TPR) repeat protein